MKELFSLVYGICLFCFSTYAAETNKPILTSTSKDSLFAHPKPYINCTDSIKDPSCSGLCTDMKIHYDEMEHVNGRDIPPYNQALSKPERYDMSGVTQRRILIDIQRPTQVEQIPYQNPNPNSALNPPDPEIEGKLKTYEVGNTNDKDCKWATIWIHGADQRKGHMGIIDNIFGGAFNRMKRLAQENHGVYYSPNIEDFGNDDGMVALIKYIRAKSCPKGKIIVNCGSAGATTCYALANDKRVAGDLGGLVVIAGGGAPDDLANFEAVKNRVPILLTQGEKDRFGSYEPAQEAVAKLHKKDPTYPVRFVLFKDGGHMTPLRMLDWRETMNCMLAQAPEPTKGSSVAAPVAIPGEDQKSSKEDAAK